MMIYFEFFYLIFILYMAYYKTFAADSSQCGDWEAYKDEKCFKIFEKVGLQAYSDAEKSCNQGESSSSLVSIRSKEEQDFFSQFLFKTHNVIDTVWIGARLTNNKFKWTDNSDMSFINWAEGNPRNITGNDCVQMMPEVPSVGKWINEPCGKKNLVVCQKLQNWSIARLQTTLLNERKEHQDSFANIWLQLKNQENKLENLQKNPVPIDFIFVQLSNQQEPNILWPKVQWKDITAEYAGLFFRAEGKGSAAFGQTQESSSPRLTNVETNYGEPNFIGALSVPSGQWSGLIRTGAGGGDAHHAMKFFVSNPEVRPRNMAIRIWKRVK